MSRQIKAILGIVAMVALFIVVVSYYNQYRHAADLVATTRTPTYESTTATKSATSKATSTTSTKKASATKATNKPRKGQKIVTIQIQGLNFRESPDKNANVIRGLEEKEELVWLSTDGNWYKVVDASGVEGFITSNEQYAKLGTKK